MKAKPFVSLLALAVAALSGCQPPPPDPVTTAFDQALSGRLKEPIAGVSRYVVKSYEVVNRSGDLVSVRLTFESQAGTDLVRTKKFRISGTRLIAEDVRDIEAHVLANLDAMAFWAIDVKEPCTWADYIAQKENAAVGDMFTDETGGAVVGEDYRQTRITPSTNGTGPILSLKLANGIEVVSRPMERYKRKTEK